MVRRRTDGSATRAGTEARDAVIRRLAPSGRANGSDVTKIAEELGTTRRHVFRLLEKWREHGTTRTLKGRVYKPPKEVATALAAADGDVDLTGIRQEHRAEIARRIGVIACFLRGGWFDKATSKAFAAEYGRTLLHFQKAVASWLAEGDPTRLPGLSYMLEDGPRDPHVGPEVNAIIDAVLADSDGTMSATTLHRRVLQEVGEAGLTYPSIHVVRDRLHRWKAVPRTTCIEASLCLDRLVFRPSKGTRPYLITLLFGGTTGYVLEHVVTSGPPSASTDAALLALHLRKARAGDRRTMLEMDLGQGEGWDAIDAMLERAGIQHFSSKPRNLRSGRLARNSFGGKLPKLDMLRADIRNMPLLDPADAVPASVLAEVSASVAWHNRKRCSDRPALLASRQASSRLADELKAGFAKA